MALNKGENAGTVFLSVSNGKLVRQFKSATPDTIERINKTGRTVYEEMYRDVTGVITGVETKENDYGKQLLITLEDGGDKYCLQMQFSSRYSSSFLKCLPNTERGAVVKIMPWQMADKNDAAKSISGITIYQNDGNGFTKVLPAYTKDEPNGLPMMKQVKVKGKVTWDDTEMMEFLEAAAAGWLARPIANGAQTETEEAPF